MVQRDPGLRDGDAGTDPAGDADEEPAADTTSAWSTRSLLGHPLTRRITGYSAGSLVAVVISEACFAAA